VDVKLDFGDRTPTPAVYVALLIPCFVY
jgi:hypothetical protein